LDDLDVDIDNSPGFSDKARLREAAIQYAESYIDSSRVRPYPVNPEEGPDADPVVPTELFPSCDLMGFWRERQYDPPAKPMIRMVRDIFSVLPHGVAVESSFSLARNVISWRQHRLNADTLRNYVMMRQHHVKSKDQLQEMDIECHRAEIADHVAVNTHIARLKEHRIHLNQRDYRAKDSELGFISDNDETGAEIDVRKLEFGCETEVRPCLKPLPAPSIARTKFFQFFTKVGRVNKQIRRPRGLDLQRAQSGTDSSDENYSSEGEDFQADEKENIRMALLDGYMSDSEKEDDFVNDDCDEPPGLLHETDIQPPPLWNFEVVIPRRRERQLEQ
jgi:hypothetical protein